MRKGIKYINGLLLVTLSLVMLLTMHDFKVKAQTNDNIGVIETSDIPAWVKGHEEVVKNTFVEAYNEAQFTVEPDAPVVPVDLGKARVILFQDFGSEGTIFLNDVKGKALVVHNGLAISHLKVLLGLEGEPLITDELAKGLLLDIVESGGETYYITDRSSEDGIFKIGKNASDEDEVQYYDKRIGIGAHDYEDVTWIEYVKGYQQGHIYMGSLGLPIAAVTRHRYTTSDVNTNGTYAKTGDTINTSEKEHTAQQFEHGWLIQARVRVLNPDNTLGGNQNVQYGAAPIWNDMYALVTALDGNGDLSKTGAPVSVEFLVEGVRYQNFEYGYVKVEAGVATFVPEAVVDSHATEMTRRVGISESWNNWNSAANQAYGLNYERLRVGQNFRELVGQMIRDGRTPFKPSDGDPYGDTRLYHRGNAAPVSGVWFSGKDGEGEYLGGANVFLYQAHWYHDAFELAPALNIGAIVDAAGGIGRPINTFKRFYNVTYQEFEGGIAYKSNLGGITTVIGETDYALWIGDYPDIESALMGKDVVINNPTNEIGTFKPGTAPMWAQNHLESIRQTIQDAYDNSGFNDVPNLHIDGFTLDKARIMFYQQFGNDGYVVMNEFLGKAFILTVPEFNSLKPSEIFLSTFISNGVKYIVTDQRVYQLNENDVTNYTHSIGAGGDVDYADVTLNDFTKAYKMAENYHPQGLGLPLESTRRVSYNTYDLNNDGTYVEGKTRSNKMHTVQRFENGYIISARMRIETGGNFNVQHGAAPITNEMYNKVISLPNNQTLNETGAPVSIQFIHNGIKYQNFEYGYVKLAINGTITFIPDLVVDSKGTEMNRRIGASDGFNNWLNRPKDYELAWERLRIGQNFREAMGELIRSGRQPYITSTSDPLGDTRIHHVPHEFDQMGVVHVYKDGEGIGGHAFGNALVIQGYWYNKAYELAPPLNELGAGYVMSGEDRIYHRTLLGRPSGSWQTISNLTFQPFEKGIAYKDGTKDIVMIYGNSFTTWMGNHATIMDAIIAKKLIKWDVKFYNADDTLLKTVKVAHHDNATSVSPTVTPPEGQVFLRWDKDITSIVDHIEVRPVFEPIKYSVTFKDFDGRVITTQEVLHGGTATAPVELARLGYTFIQWDRALTNITSDTTIHALYTINEYTITYLPEGMTHTNPTTYTIESIITLTPPQAADGYAFVRWEDAAGIVVETIENQTGDLTLTAKFSPITYHITYHHLEEGDINTNNANTFTVNDLPLSLSPLLITRTGHTFVGWFSDSDLSLSIDAITTIGHKDVYAKITPNSHTITYKVTDQDDVVETYVYGDTITLRPPLEKHGYDFSWDKVLPETMPDEDIIVYGTFIPTVYTITYQPAGMTHTNPTTYTIETHIQLVNASKTGYRFMGWFDENNEPLTEIPLGQTGNKTITASFSLNYYDIEYHIDGGDNHPSNPLNYSIQSDTLVLLEPTKVGYTFAGWFEDDQFEYGITEIEPTEWLPSTVTLYAKWTINTYTISFDSDGGTPVAPLMQAYNTPLTKPSDPTKTGHTFVKWVDQDNVEFVFTTIPHHDVALTAIWTINTYTITFELNGGHSDIVNLSQTYHSLLELPTPTKEGDTFRGWFTDALLQHQFTLTHMPDYDFTLYAGYTKLPILTFDLDGGSFAIVTISQEPNTPIVLEGEPTKVGYTFSGWTPALPDVMPTVNITVKAVWTPNDYTINFDSDGGSNVAPLTQPYNTSITQPGHPKKTGYTFIKWVDENEVAYVFDKMPAYDVQLTAVWQINQYTLTFDSDGGSVVESIHQDFNTPITAPIPPTKEGYTFSGWSPALPALMPAENKVLKATWQVNTYKLTIKVSGSEDVIFNYEYNALIQPIEEAVKLGYTFIGWDREIPTTMPAMDLTIEALFELTTYTITYHHVDGVHNNVESYTILTPTITLLDIEKEGYAFLGWYPLADAGDVIRTIQQGSTGDINLYARFTILSYTVTYIVDEVVYGEVETYVYQSPITPRPLPTKDGHTFSGWDMEIPTTMPAENKVFKGSFTVNQYQVIFKDKEGHPIGDVQLVNHNAQVIPPEAPIVIGYTFMGWDQPTTNITSDRTIQAIYKVNTYNVSFVDREGNLIGDVQVIAHGEAAIAPTAPVVEGFEFERWDQPFTNITNHLEVKAIYVVKMYDVKFIDNDNLQIGQTIRVEHGASITAPTPPEIEGYRFVQWDKSLDSIKRNTTIKAVYEAITHEVKFVDKDDNQLGQTQYVRHYQAAVAPDVPVVIGYTFVKWDRDFSNITTSLEVKAIYEPNVYEVRFLDSDQTVIGEVQHILHGENALAPNPPIKPDYRFLKWSHSYENIKQNLDITALYELSFTQADMMMELRTLKTLIQQVNALDGLLKDLPANEYYMVEDTLSKLKTDIENIESALLAATTEEDILAISKSIEKASQEYNLSVVKGEKVDNPNPDDPNPDDPEDPVKPKQGVYTAIIVISIVGALVFVGVIVRMVFRFKK